MSTLTPPSDISILSAKQLRSMGMDVLGRLPYVVITVAVPDYRPVYLNGAAAELLRTHGIDDPSAILDRYPWEVIPEWEEPFRPVLESAHASAQPRILNSLPYRRPLGLRYWDIVAIPHIGETTGEVTHITGIGIDVTQRLTAEQELERSSRETTAILERVTDGFVALDSEWRYIYANRNAELLLQRPRNELLGRTLWDISPTAVGSGLHEACHRAMSEQKPASIEHYSETFHLWFENHIFPSRDGVSMFFSDITERRTRAELSDALNRISSAVNSTLDIDEIIHRAIAESANALHADNAAVNLREAGRWIVGYTYNLPHTPIGHRFTDEEAEVSALVACTNQLVAVKDLHRDPRFNPERIRNDDILAVLAVPLILKGDVLGVIKYRYQSVKPHFSEAELDFASKVATSVSLAVHNAQLIAELHDEIAERKHAQETIQHQLTLLQRALLPAQPSIGEGYSLASRYIPAFAGELIGGDFYDVFHTEDGRVGILMGDVSGKGIRAASLAASARNTVRAFAYDTVSPGEALRHTNEVLTAQHIGLSQFVTMFLVIMDAQTGEIRYSSAGHPPALLHRSHGLLEFLSCNNTPIGIFPRERYAEASDRVMPGDRLILFTDGITDARRQSALFGIHGIESIVHGNRSDTAQNLVDRILDAAREWARGRLADDIAIIVIDRDDNNPRLPL